TFRQCATAFFFRRPATACTIRTIHTPQCRFNGGQHMAKKRDSDRKDRKLQGEKSVSRRDFVKKGAAGVSAAVLSTSATALAQVSPAQAIQWNYEADIVIIGGGCTGLSAALRARGPGASGVALATKIDP